VPGILWNSKRQACTTTTFVRNKRHQATQNKGSNFSCASSSTGIDFTRPCLIVITIFSTDSVSGTLLRTLCSACTILLSWRHHISIQHQRATGGRDSSTEENAPKIPYLFSHGTSTSPTCCTAINSQARCSLLLCCTYDEWYCQVQCCIRAIQFHLRLHLISLSFSRCRFLLPTCP